jgi:hypothetical protein
MLIGAVDTSLAQEMSVGQCISWKPIGPIPLSHPVLYAQQQNQKAEHLFSHPNLTLTLSLHRSLYGINAAQSIRLQAVRDGGALVPHSFHTSHSTTQRKGVDRF